MKVNNIDKNVNVTLKPLKLEFESCGSMSQPVLKKLCGRKPKFKKSGPAQIKISK